MDSTVPADHWEERPVEDSDDSIFKIKLTFKTQ